jgi:hypothetical protein
LGSGVLLQLTVRPKDQGADLLFGASVGAVAGLTAFVGLIGPVAAAQSTRTNNLTNLLHRWKELGAELALRKRWSAASEVDHAIRFKEDLVRGAMEAFWASLNLSLVGGVMVCAGSASLAGHYRRGEHRLPQATRVRQWLRLLPPTWYSVFPLFLGSLCLVGLWSQLFGYYRLAWGGLGVLFMGSLVLFYVVVRSNSSSVKSWISLVILLFIVMILPFYLNSIWLPLAAGGIYAAVRWGNVSWMISRGKSGGQPGE